ncbi:hypothetical protein ACS0TY_033426 [Phlomoides rotata]
MSCNNYVVGGLWKQFGLAVLAILLKDHSTNFVDRFGILAPKVLDGSTDEVAVCKKLLDKERLEGYQIGKTKVFLRAGQMAELDARRSEVLGRSASIIQRKYRSCRVLKAVD